MIVGKVRISLHDGDILKEEADAIVNPTNNQLELYNGGIAG